MNEEFKYIDLFRKTLDLIAERPTNLERALLNTADSQEIDFSDPMNWLSQSLRTAELNTPVFCAMGLVLRRWDRVENGSWLNGTVPHSSERRELVYARLGLPSDMYSFLNKKMPIYQEADLPIVIAEKHEEWYANRPIKENFYWKAYSKYLREVKRWDEDAIAKLDHSTDEVIRRLSDPCRKEVYPNKGLVVGYVQSGKTANFSGVLAKAADAGYRFIIVLAGTLDILRSQTQRRIDKELVGRELLKSDYSNDGDWHEFLSHGGRPSEMGAFDWERLTGPHEDYRELKHAISALEFKPTIPGKPYNSQENLRTSPLRIIVIKKNPKVMVRLAHDLAEIHSKLEHVPTLIVDDESDQASINTLDPSKPRKDAERTRTATNYEIVHLLKALPRAQYLGYTATPFANVFVDPSDAEDLFPKDFIISLPRPKGYMGVMDFYDFDSEPEGFESNEKAYVRDVRGDDLGGEMIDGKLNPNHLQKAIDCFVLAGAMKLFREHQSNRKFTFKHHTMLVHHSVSKADHTAMAEKVKQTFEHAGYLGGKGIARLEEILTSDFTPVSAAKGSGLSMPSSFKELEPFVGKCLAKLMEQPKTVLIVNGDNKDDTPDFDKGSVWAILVGGTKLSRGYTVEGLTTTYFRRVSNTTDTLMQMGRWFGYRSGYKDLVRLFIGRDEPFGNKGKNRLDLYEAFRAVCLDEEKFRQEIRKYCDEKNPITPKEVPPLVPSHLTTLSPTAKNKMYNAYITFKNFGGEWSEPTLATVDKVAAGKNSETALSLLSKGQFTEYKFSGSKRGAEGKSDSCNVRAYCGLLSNSDIRQFLTDYLWNHGRPVLQHEIEFMSGSEGDPEISDWLVMIPLVTETKNCWPPEKVAAISQIPVQKRSRIGERFKVYTTSSHRAVAEYIASTSERFQPTDESAKALIKPHRGVMLFYPVKDDNEDFVSIGFALLFPKNNIQRKIHYSVRNKSRPEDVVVLTEPNPEAGRS